MTPNECNIASNFINKTTTLQITTQIPNITAEKITTSTTMYFITTEDTSNGNSNNYFIIATFITFFAIIGFLVGNYFGKMYKCSRTDAPGIVSKTVEIEAMLTGDANNDKNEKNRIFNEDFNTTSNTTKQKVEQSLVVIGEFTIGNFVSDKLDWDNRTLINSGAFGNVYKCPYRDNDGAYYVAVKEAKKHSKEAFKEREFMAQLKDHPHVIKLITTLIDDNMYLVMPLRKANLTSFLENTRNITITHKIRYCQQIANGMSYLMFRQVLHCDLKASNILVVDENFVQISDFGKSQKMGTIKRTVGTITHTAIELLNPPLHAINCEASDIWSFGVTIWEIFNKTRQHPYAVELKNVTEVRLLEYLGSKNHLQTTFWPSTDDSPPLEAIKTHMIQCWCRNKEDRPTFNFLWGLFSSKLPECNALPFKLSENSTSNSRSIFK